MRTRALHLDLKADFTKKTLSGHAELTLDWLDKTARRLDLDTRELTIAKIEAQDARGRWAPVKYALDAFDSEKGQALHIDLATQAPKVRIYYRTAPTASALQWLTPAQTLSGKRPFMFSQSETINARSWVPVQDTPSMRFTYTARIQAPTGLRVVMSADNDPKATGKGGWKFNMPQPIPSYLDRHRRAGGAHPGRAHRRLRRAGPHRRRSLRIRRHREDGRRRRIAVRSVSLGALRHAGVAAFVPDRRHGKPAPDLPHPDHDRGRPQPGRPDCP
ncbi:hypothetical protein [Massilia sp. Dwa41.01b]|uniref:hypothetical protein n=1 Tax=Massilia sp. Dwa41.01b TaxID=2709302 RepID=UPI0035A621DB